MLSKVNYNKLESELRECDSQWRVADQKFADYKKITTAESDIDDLTITFCKKKLQYQNKCTSFINLIK